MDELLPAMTNQRIIELAYYGAYQLLENARFEYAAFHRQPTKHTITELEDEVTILAKLMDEYNH